MTLLSLTPAASADAGARLTAHLHRLAERFADAAARVHAGDDPEAVHDLRVTARRLESALQVWRTVLARKSRRRARRLLRRIRREAGPVREAEVHATHLADCSARVGEEHRVAIEQELARLSKQVARGRRRLARQLTSRRIERVWTRVRRATRGLETPPAGAGAPQVETRRRTALEALLAARPTLDDAPLHDARIAVKKWRYAEESFAAGRGADAAGATRQLKSVQSDLGRIHDRATLRDHVLQAAARAESRGETARATALAALSARLEAERVEQVLRFRRDAVVLTDDTPVEDPAPTPPTQKS